VRITNPDDGDVVEKDIKVRGRADDPDARDNVTLIEVAIMDEGESPGPGDWMEAEDVSDDGDWATWRMNWNASEEEEGNYTLHARSFDGDEYSEIDIVEATVIHQDLPVITVEAPDDGIQIDGLGRVEGTASDQDWTDEIDAVKIAIMPEGEDPISGDWMDADDVSSGNPYAEWEFDWNSSEYEDGNYTIHAKSASSNGHFSRTWLVNITIENVNFRPEVTFTEPDEKEDVRETVTIAGYVIDEDDDIDTIECSIDDPGFDEVLTLDIQKVDRNNWTFKTDWNTRHYDVGSHRIYVRATDARGQESRVWSVNVSVINVTPEIGFTVLIDEKDEIDLEYENIYTIEWVDSDPDDNASIEFYRDTNPEYGDGTEEVLIVSGIGEDGGDSYDWDVTDVPEGRYYLYAVIDDGVNDPTVNYTAHRLEIIQVVPNGLPEIEITNLMYGMNIGGQVEVQGTADDNDGSVSSVMIRIGSGPWTTCTDDPGDWSTWSYVWNTTDHPDGVISISASATDDGDGTANVTIDVYINNTDLRKPSVVIVLPAGGDGPFAGSMEMSGTATDPENALVRVEISVDDNGFDDTTICTGTTVWTASVDVSGLDSGYHTFYARAIDDEGLVSPYDSITVRIDNRKPVAVIGSVAPGETTIDVGTFTFRGYGENGVIVAYEWSTEGFGVLGDDETVHCPAGSLSVGEHEIRFRVQGENGLWSDPVSETVTVIEEPVEDEDKKDSGTSFMAIIGVIALVIIVLAVVALRKRNGRTDGTEAYPAQLPDDIPPEPVGAYVPPTVLCPICGGMPIYYPEYGRHYCHTCRAYLPEGAMPDITIADHDI